MSWVCPRDLHHAEGGEGPTLHPGPGWRLGMDDCASLLPGKDFLSLLPPERQPLEAKIPYETLGIRMGRGQSQARNCQWLLKSAAHDGPRLKPSTLSKSQSIPLWSRPPPPSHPCTTERSSHHQQSCPGYTTVSLGDNHTINHPGSSTGKG